MSPEQVEKWKDFTRRMCLHAWPHATEARKQKLWKKAESFIDAYKDEPIDGWDQDYCLCDSFDEFFGEYEVWHKDKRGNEWPGLNPHYFFNQLRCAIRAGIDVVFDTDGIIGFDVGDLRRMYDGQIPAWVSGRYDGGLPDDLPDDCMVWL